MPEGTVSFNVEVPLKKAWELFKNLEDWALCVPGCREIEKISENEFEGVIEARVLRTSRKIRGRVQMIEVNPPTHIEYCGQGELSERFLRYKVTLKATLDLQAVSESQTKIDFAGSVHSSGLGGAIINKIASSQMKGTIIKDFEQNVRDRLER